MAEIAMSHRVVERQMLSDDNFINGSGRRRLAFVPANTVNARVKIHGHICLVFKHGRVEVGTDASALLTNAQVLNGGTPFRSDL